MKRALVLLAMFASVAQAEPVSLRLDHAPAPRHLRMRPRRTAAVAAPAAEPLPDDQPAVKTTSNDALPLGTLRDLRRPISVRFNLGYVVDGTALSGHPTKNDQPVSIEQIDRLRTYALGEAYFSSRGVVAPSLSTYLAAHFQIARPSFGLDPNNAANKERIGPPVATWFEYSGLEPRQVWAEAQDFLPDPHLAPLRVRAGELYIYGPWMLHMYGALAGWEGKLLKFQAYGGSRVPDYTNNGIFDRKDRAGIAGSTATVDLRALKTPIPFAVGLELLKFTAAGADANQAANHAALQLDWRPKRDVALIARLRAIDGDLAHEYVQFRSRFRQVTNLVFDYTHRHDRDWRWDPSIANSDPLEAKRYLDLGPVLPQSIVSGRAGTLIKENVDLLVRGAWAWEQVPTAAEKRTYTAGYKEIGAAAELRLRRTIGLGLSALTRQTDRTGTISNEIPDIPNQIDPLPQQFSSDIGERGFTELGTTLRLTLGARRLSALVEVFGRRTRYALVYCQGQKFLDGTINPVCMSAIDTGLETQDVRGGGRFTLDAWVGQRLHLFASYELSSKIDFQPEITGFKSLRLIMEGVY